MPPAGESLAAIQHRCSQEVSPDTFYQQLAERAFQFGPTFRSIRRLWRGEGEALGEVVLEDSLAHMSGRVPSASGIAGWLHPGVRRRSG